MEREKEFDYLIKNGKKNIYGSSTKIFCDLSKKKSLSNQVRFSFSYSASNCKKIIIAAYLYRKLITDLSTHTILQKPTNKLKYSLFISSLYFFSQNYRELRSPTFSLNDCNDCMAARNRKITLQKTRKKNHFVKLQISPIPNFTASNLSFLFFHRGEDLEPNLRIVSRNSGIGSA